VTRRARFGSSSPACALDKRRPKAALRGIALRMRLGQEVVVSKAALFEARKDRAREKHSDQEDPFVHQAPART